MRQKQRRHGPVWDLSRRFVCRAPDIATHIFCAVDTPFSLGLAILLENRCYLDLVSASVNPMDYTSADTFAKDYLCAELMSKYPSWELGIDRAQVALTKLIQSEEKCLETNARFRAGFRDRSVSVTTTSVIATASRKIAHLLGPFNWDEASQYFDWGPGASTSLPRRCGDAYYKFGAVELHASSNLRPLVEALRLWRPLWAPAVSYVRGSRITTVPKNAKTDRCIAIEPDLNMFFQKGIGGVIRRRLHRRGLLLPDAQERNALLAWEGSKTGGLATIDLSSASDTISLEVVRALLPDDWVAAIELCRSPEALLPSGDWLSLQKVSSMGNGFTFELETLIFWALSESVRELHGDLEHRVSVYGDDIIVGTDTARALLPYLEVFGFTVNQKKSFLDGPFRESCGKHFFHGTDVTPFYVRDPIDSPRRLFWVANSIKIWSALAYGLSPTLKPVYDFVVSLIPKSLRSLSIPRIAPSDSGLYRDFDAARPAILRACHRSSKKLRGFEGYAYRLARESTRSLGVDGKGRLLKGLHALEKAERIESDTGCDVLQPGRLKIGTSVAQQWCGFGPWL